MVRSRAAIILALSSTLLMIAATELAARVLAGRGRVLYQPYATAAGPAFWVDLDPGFGVWHPPHASFHHVGPCWDVTYHTNSYGARDPERARRSSALRRHVVLGDSFIEGYGIADGERLTNRLSVSTGEDFLNFGTGGGFGTVQELVLYRTLASTFDHSDVLLFVLPINDFVDNNPRYYPSSRYRPYLRRTSNGYETYYTVRFDDRDIGALAPPMRAWNWLSNQSYVLNAARRVSEQGAGGRQPDVWTSYAGHSADDLELMTEAIRELAAAAGSRRLHVFLIPIQTDLDDAIERGREYDLPARLREAVASAGNADVTDLLPAFVDYVRQHQVPTSAFFQPCDFHWSPLGNAVAAGAVEQLLAPVAERLSVGEFRGQEESAR